ncbi:MAG: DEAD/DEAH box helicase [Thermodesulfobacteriota bacterium]
MQFDSFDFHSSIIANIKRLGYEAPTPIQREAFPHVLGGRDVMGLAQTGTGKTAAFLLPIIDRFLKNPQPLRGSARALVIAPTRELAEQIHESARDYARGLKFRSVTVYGGVGMGPQAGNLRRGADIVVACPGRLLDHLNQGNANLSGVEVLVLDEADHMFDMGFLPDIKKILSKLPAERQTLLFSATMPESIKGLASETLKDPALVRIGRTAPAQTIEQHLYPVQQHLKTKLLLSLLGEMDEGSTLVFTRTKHRAKRLAEQLCRMGHTSACLQGNLSQAQRQKAMEGFRAGKYRVLVATDIAARGIDVSRVANVVNYDLPDTPETYTHRVGRTGRAEREGRAHSLMTSEDVSMVKAIERLLGKAIERRKLDGFDYTASAPERDREFERPPLPARGGQGRGNGYGRAATRSQNDGERASTGRSDSAGRQFTRSNASGAGESRGRSAGGPAGANRQGGSGKARDWRSGGENRAREASFSESGEPRGARAGNKSGGNRSWKDGSEGRKSAGTPAFDTKSRKPARTGNGFYGSVADAEPNGNRWPSGKPDVNGNTWKSAKNDVAERPDRSRRGGGHAA